MFFYGYQCTWMGYEAESWAVDMIKTANGFCLSQLYTFTQVQFTA